MQVPKIIAAGCIIIATVPACLADAAPKTGQANATQRAEAEARTYLPPCVEKEPERQQLCLLNQRNFIEQYVLAKAGDAFAMGSTAFSFDPSTASTEFSKTVTFALQRLGEPASIPQACAWRMVIVDQPTRPHGQNDVEITKAVCGRLSDAGYAEAVARARSIEREIDTHTTSMPPDDWDPKVQGLHDFELPKGKLDDTPQPLLP